MWGVVHSLLLKIEGFAEILGFEGYMPASFFAFYAIISSGVEVLVRTLCHSEPNKREFNIYLILPGGQKKI